MNLRRLARGVGANAFNKLAIAIVQLALVPIFSIHWGISVYGGWVMLSTIPSFLAVSDLGFAGAAANDMTMLVAKGERLQASQVFQSAWAVMLTSSLAMIVLSLVVAFYLPERWLPVTSGFTASKARSTLEILMLYGIAALQGSIIFAGLRAAGHYYEGTMCSALTIIAENGIAGVAVWRGAQPVETAAILLLVRALGLSGQAVLLTRRASWLAFGLKQASRTEMKRLLAPALAMMMIPLSQAAVLQGTALMLGIALGQSAVPAFSATRTLSRVGLQLTQLLNNALMPEYSVAVGRNDRPSQAAMVLVTLLAAAAVLLPFSLLLAIFGKTIVLKWTGGTIGPSESLLLTMSATVVFGGFWNPVSNLILAMNRHASFTYPYIAFALIIMPLTYFLAKVIGIAGAGLAMALLDLAMCLVILRIAGHILPSPVEVIAASRQVSFRKFFPFVRHIRKHS